jgi:hypothetical protein
MGWSPQVRSEEHGTREIAAIATGVQACSLVNLYLIIYFGVPGHRSIARFCAGFAEWSNAEDLRSSPSGSQVRTLQPANKVFGAIAAIQAYLNFLYGKSCLDSVDTW